MVNGHGGPGAGAGSSGVADMVTISDIDEHVINRNLKIRYSANKIYVSIEIYIMDTNSNVFGTDI